MLRLKLNHVSKRGYWWQNLGTGRTKESGAHNWNLVNIFFALPDLPLDKMAAIFADDILKCIFVNENSRIPIEISLKFVPRSLIDYKPALVQVMAWCRTGDKPLPEPMLTQFIDAYMRHKGEMN